MSYLRYTPEDFRKTESIWLSEFSSDIFSQFGEDGIIGKVLEIIGSTNAYCVEFGAWDGTKYSNCRNLLVNKGWSGLLIEGDPDRYEELRESYRDRPEIATLNTYVDLGERSLDLLLDSVRAPSGPDLMSIDVDGMDWHIWSSLKRYRPRIVIIEFNPCIPNEVAFIQDNDPSINHGSSLFALIGLGKLKGYELIATTTTNAVFVVDQEFAKFNIKDNSIHAMRANAPFEMKIFQLYDGTLKIAGYTQLHRLEKPLSEDDLQAVPPAERRFGG